MGKTAKNRRIRKPRTFKKQDFKSGDGMLTTVWGPGLWHYLHTLSFNYPWHPSPQDKHAYKNQILLLEQTLPCKYCRINLKKNFKMTPILNCHMENRDTFSRYVYLLHETVNKMLGKTSGLTYCDVRERYEHFRARCLTKKRMKTKLWKLKKTKKTKKANKENGCTDPLYGKKAKCVIQIVPTHFKCNSFKIHKKCLIKR